MPSIISIYEEPGVLLAVRPVLSDSPAAEQAEPQVDLPEAERASGEDEVKVEDMPKPATRIVDDSADDAPTRRLDLSALRFGRNYEIQ